MKLPGLYQKTDSRIFYYQPPMAKGVRPRPISLGTKVEAEAVEAYYALRHDAQDAFRRGSLRMEAARFLEQKRLARIHRPGSSVETERVIKAAVDLLGNREVSSYTHADIQRLHQVWMQRGLSAATISAYVARLRAFFAWAMAERLCKVNPAKGLAMPKNLPTRSERYCTKEEREMILAACPGDRPDLALILWLGFFAGLRRREIDQARRDWVDLAAGVIQVRTTETFAPKSNRGVRTIRLSPRLFDFLSAYLERAPERPRRLRKGDGGERKLIAMPAARPDDYLVRPDKLPGRKIKTRGKLANRYRFDARRPFRDLVGGIGLGWVGFHTMRHTFATLHALAGTPLTTLAKELGEEAETTFHHYVGYQREGGHAGAVD